MPNSPARYLPFTLPVLAALVYLIVLLIAFQDTVASMIDIWWRAKTYNHCFFIAPISLWLIWEKRAELRRTMPKPYYPAFFLVCLLGGFWLISNLVDVLVTQQLALVGLLISGLWAVLGTATIRSIFFPLCFLFFSVPIGDGLIPYLMEYTAFFTVWCIKLTGIPVYQEGLILYLPSGVWEVIEACSGIRYLIASLSLGSLFAYLNYTSTIKRIIFMMFSILVPILANGVRAYLIVLLGHITNLKFAAGDDHLVIGWVFYGLVIFILFAVGIIWRDPQPQSQPQPQPPLPSQSQPTAEIAAERNRLLPSLVMAIVLAGVWPTYLALQSKTPPAQNAQSWPEAFNALTKEAHLPAPWDWKPARAGADLESDNFISLPEGTVSIHLRQFFTQHQGAEITNHWRFLHDPQMKWRMETRKTGKVTFLHQGRQAKANEYLLYSGGRKLLVWSWYKIGPDYTANDYIAKLLEAKQTILRNAQGSIRIFIATEISQDVSREQARIQAEGLLAEAAARAAQALAAQNPKGAQ